MSAATRIRVLPTGAGIVFLLAVAALVLAAINYNNNVLYALAFFLAASGTLSAGAAWRALAGLKAGAVTLEPAFAGGRAPCRVQVTEADGRARQALTLAAPRLAESQPWWVGGGATAVLTLEVPAPRRGRLSVDGLRLCSRHPFGLFRASRRLAGTAAAPVYPAVEQDGPVPHDAWRAAARSRAESEGFSHFRDYAPGDAPARIHWKALAGRDALVTKVFDGARGGAAVWLDWRDTGCATAAEIGEASLSRLARWVLEVEAHELDYGLRLPGREIAPARGPQQRRRCLEALANHALAAAPAAAPAGRRLAWRGQR